MQTVWENHRCRTIRNNKGHHCFFNSRSSPWCWDDEFWRDPPSQEFTFHSRGFDRVSFYLQTWQQWFCFNWDGSLCRQYRTGPCPEPWTCRRKNRRWSSAFLPSFFLIKILLIPIYSHRIYTTNLSTSFLIILIYMVESTHIAVFSFYDLLKIHSFL